MKKQMLFIAIGLITLSSQGAALADDWFKHHDRDVDSRWNYEEYAAAQRDWELHHKGHHMSDKELREYYARLDHDRDGFLTPEEARRAHHW